MTKGGVPNVPSIDIVYAQALLLANNMKLTSPISTMGVQDRSKLAIDGTRDQRMALTESDPAQLSKRIFGQSLVSLHKDPRS